MIIKEGALLKALDKSYKGCGYWVAAQLQVGKLYMLFRAFGYQVRMVWGQVPRKILGLVVEHLGKFPVADEAFYVCKKDVQSCIFDVTMDGLLEMLEDAQENNLPRVRNTPLTFQGLEVWQQRDDMKVLLVKPEMSDILRVGNAGLELVNGSLYAHDDVSDAFVHPQHLDAAKVQMDHLGALQWVQW